MCMSSMQCFITSTGQIEPAMMPVLKLATIVSGNSAEPRSPCIAMNIVGTP